MAKDLFKVRDRVVCISGSSRGEASSYVTGEVLYVDGGYHAA